MPGCRTNELNGCAISRVREINLWTGKCSFIASDQLRTLRSSGGDSDIPVGILRENIQSIGSTVVIVIWIGIVSYAVPVVVAPLGRILRKCVERIFGLANG